MTRSFTPVAALIIAILLSIAGVAQSPGSSSTAASGSRAGQPGAKTAKDVSTARIEQDMSEALTVIPIREDHHVVCPRPGNPDDARC